MIRKCYRILYLIQVIALQEVDNNLDKAIETIISLDPKQQPQTEAKEEEKNTQKGSRFSENTEPKISLGNNS